MARIKIIDIPKDQKISREELKKIRGGIVVDTTLDDDFMLQKDTTQVEERPFQTLSDASKARYDIAMISLSNIKT